MMRLSIMFLAVIFQISVFGQTDDYSDRELDHWLKIKGHKKSIECVLDSIHPYKIDYFLLNGSESKTIRVKEIEWVAYRPKHTSRAGLFIGGILGGLVGGVIYSEAISGSSFEFQKAMPAILVGAGVGAGIGIYTGSSKKKIHLDGVFRLSSEKKQELLRILR